MKKILLSLTLTLSGFMAISQAVVSGVSPASIQGNYDYASQAHAGWPGYTAGQAADENWNLALDFNVDGTNVEGELELIYDATPGVNPEGVDSMYEGCGTLINTDLTGKIAIVYRNTCDFAAKAYNAQQLGAIGLIIINREDATNITMTASAIGDGPNVTIPVVMITKTDGGNIVSEMDNGPVVMFIGNKIGVNANDLGAIKGEFLISPFATHNSLLMNGFDLGIQVYNYGSAVQSTATVNATIVGPGSAVVYNETVNLPAMNSTDTVPVFNGNPSEFPPFDMGGVGNYPLGDYTLTYTIDLGVADDSDYDNTYSSEFSVTDRRLSLARNNSNEPVVNSYPSNTDSEYQSCMFIQDPNASLTALRGVYFAPYTDTALYELEGAEIFVNVYKWNDTWTDINDPSITANNDYFTDMQLIATETHYPATDLDNGLVQYVPLTNDIQLEDDQRYLVCNHTYDQNISFGYDNGVDYGGNISLYAMPAGPIQVGVEGTLTWYIAGWNGSPGNGIMLDIFDASQLGLDDESILEGKAFPNPTNNNVTISLEAIGSGQLTVTDISGKIAMSESITLVNGQTNINMSKLDDGVYIFNVALESGQTSQFNVVKN